MTEPANVQPMDAELRDLPVTDVEALLVTLSKTVRAHQMYESNNPIYRRFNESLTAGFRSIFGKTDGIELTVREDGFGYGDRVFAVGQGRDSLAFALYKDGVRYLKFLPGFENEVQVFLKALARARRRDDDVDDMIAVLWEEDFEYLQYGYVDLFSDGLTLPESEGNAFPALGGSPLDLDLELDAGLEDQKSGSQAPAAPASGPRGLTREDFDETLYFMDPGEMNALQREVDLEMSRDLHRDVLNALFDRLEEPGLAERQAEIMSILDQLLPLFLSRGHMGAAALILEELDALVSDGGAVDPVLAARIDQLFQRLGAVEVLEQFVQALADGAVAPEAAEVTLFFSRLQAGALPVLLRFAELTQTAAVRDRLASAVDGLASRFPDAVSALLSSGDDVLVRGAARAAGRGGLTRAVSGLEAALTHPNPGVRLTVVEALAAIRATPALVALTDALGDQDREVRIAAAKALGAVRFASARDALSSALDDRRFKDRDLTEKMTFYEAYGAVGGTAAVKRLDRILNDKGFLGRRPSSELRACAALGLGQVGSPAARAALEKARNDGDTVVRNSVIRALRQEADRP